MSIPEWSTSTESGCTSSLLDRLIQAALSQNDEDVERAKDSFKESLTSIAERGETAYDDVKTTIKTWVDGIDKLLSMQISAILHHPDFQKLESTWRGLHYLVQQSDTGKDLKIRVFNISKQELLRDLEATEFDQTVFFARIYADEYEQTNGEPYGMLVGDYEFGPSAEDVGLLRLISHVAEYAHTPFVAAASPTMFGYDSFAHFSEPKDLAGLFAGTEYAAWNSFRNSEESRYVALTLPRVLSRPPYGKERRQVKEFNFEEFVAGDNRQLYLWMNAAWAYAARVTDAFSKYGWMLRTKGVEGGGRVEGIPVCSAPAADGKAVISPTEIDLSERCQLELSSLGFLPLSQTKDRDFAVIVGERSCHKPKTYFDPGATANAELSARFNLLLTVSRFAHYLKVMARDKMASFVPPEECETWLNEWIMNYCMNPSGADEQRKAECPLSDAQVQVREAAGRAGSYEVVAYLRPHYQLETLNNSVRLVAAIPMIG